MRRALFERRRERPYCTLHKKDYIYKIFGIHDNFDIFFILSWSRSNLFSRIVVHSVYPCEITSIEPIQNERSIWSLMRTFFVSTSNARALPRFVNSTQLRWKRRTSQSARSSCVVSSRCISSLLLRPQLWDIVAFLRWSGSVILRVWQSFFIQRLVMQCRDWWSLPVTTS